MASRHVPYTDISDMGRAAQETEIQRAANQQLIEEGRIIKHKELEKMRREEESKDDSSSERPDVIIKELAYQKMQIVELTHRLDYARHQIEARDQLIVEHGLVLIGGTNVDDNPTSNMEELTATNAHMSSTNKGKFTSNDSNLVMMNGLSNNNNNHSKSNSLIHQNGDKSSNHLPEMVLITKSTAELLNTLSETTLDKQIQQLFSMRSELDARVEELESQLREERKRFEAPTTRYDSKNRTNIANAEDIKHELQQSRNQAQEYKLKFHESSQKISALESDIVRLEGQTKRYKAIADACEEQEEILKQDRRKCQRELREVQSKLEDLKAENARLQRVVDKYNRGSTVPGSLAPGASSTIRQAHDSSVNR
ncbi:uncharacterized protein DC041_0004519 [Schistosoma bovis]|uniref:Leucine-rich repeat flightless-interacting protein 2 n=1 Tax=Schistosoma bovis TaxID=6184 RepID=A0A430Q714_SCHBO|nr:uncharacterized protein DC041_0004519 [Schistosoma bovis]